MVLTLRLPQEVERELSTEATRLGMPLEQYALRLLCQPHPVSTAPQNGAELVAYWKREGVIGSRPDIADSPRHARELRRRAETRLRS